MENPGILFLFFLGYKRIGMIGLVAAILFYVLMRKERIGVLKASGLVMMLAILVYGISYVVIVRSGLFVRICTELGVELMGRQNLYRYIKDYYHISPAFMGHGFGCIEYILGHAGDIKVNNTYISRMTALHCDYLAMYIQMGMIGFLLWEICRFVDIPLSCSRYGKECYLSALLTTLYLGITYMTDNTALYFLVCMVQFLIPAAFAAKGGTSEEKKIYVIMAVLLITGAGSAFLVRTAKPNSVQAEISLRYGQAGDGLTPAGTRFDAYEILSNDVLENAGKK